MLVIAAVVLAGCGDDPDGAAPGPSPSSAATSTRIVRAAPTAKPSAIDDAPEPGEAPTSRDDTASDTERRNELGEPWTLDASASSACAQAEFALTAFDEGGDPERLISAAVVAAKPSKTTVVRDAAATLAGPDATRVVVADFLAVCVQGGYEL